jgi:hypothetical protein
LRGKKGRVISGAAAAARLTKSLSYNMAFVP